MLVSGAETGDIQQSCVALKTARSMTTDTLHLLFTCFSGCIEELYLRISRGMTMSLSDLSALRILELSMGVIAYVSNFSSNCLESLTIIATSKVTFRNTSCEAIGKYLSSTCSLKTCHLRAVDGKTLILSDDQLEAITKGMSDNIALPLESLEINCECSFTTTATRSLAQFITRSTTLQYLRLCSVTFRGREFIELVVAVNHSSSLLENKLEKFDLFCSDMSTEEDRANLTPLFNSHADLVHIQSSLGDTTSLAQSNNTCIVSAGIFALNRNCCKSLWLRRNGINNTGAVALAQALHHNSTLEWLYLSNNSISDAGAVALAQALHHNSTLKKLDLSNNSISDAGAVALAQALHHNSTLKGLDLSNNSISDAGAVALAQALHHLEKLYLSNNSISDAGAVALEHALHHNSTLKELHLSNDSISDAGAVALAQTLHHNSTLERLDLSYNSISDAGAVALAQALHHNSTLKVLDLSSNNRISDAGAVALAQALHHNSTLKMLNLFGNNAIGEESTHQLVQTLTVNTSISSLRLPKKCKKYATQCREYDTVKKRIFVY